MDLTRGLPTTAMEFERRFGSEEACIDFLSQQRWPEGFRCPKCGGAKGWPLRARPLIECAACGRQTSVIAGTVFEGTRKPLTIWFRVISQFVVSKSGCSATDLSRQHGLRLETAWTWLHKIRSCFGRDGRDPLKRSVEVDEMMVGGLEEGHEHKGRSTHGKKVLVVGAVEKRGKGCGRARLAVAASAAAAALCGFVERNVQRGARVKTDGWRAYGELPKRGFRHVRVVVGAPKNAAKILPCVHRVFSLAKRLILGTYQGAVAPWHLQAYLDEYVFRFNRRSSGNRWLLFQRVIASAFRTGPTYRELQQRRQAA